MIIKVVLHWLKRHYHSLPLDFTTHFSVNLSPTNTENNGKLEQAPHISNLGWIHVDLSLPFL